MSVPRSERDPDGWIEAPMTKRICSECGRPKRRVRAVIQHADGTIARVCGACWQRWEYDRYLAARA